MTTEVVLEKVPFAIVHKEFDDDVLIANMRGLTPSWIPARALDEPGLSDEERELLRFAYGHERPDLSAGESILGLSSLPAAIATGVVDTLPREIHEAVGRHYGERGSAWHLESENVDEMDLVLLMSHFIDRAWHLSDEDRFQVSRALDKVTWLVRPKVSCFNMVMDTTNYFFYRKHHEHVPGMMLIEVVRQAMYAQYYRYSTFAKGQISLTIENLNVNFMGFVNANYPVRVQVADHRSEAQIASDAPNEERVATFSQLGRVVAVATMRANPIRMNLFKRLRNIKPSAQARFIPRKCIAPVGMFSWRNMPAMEGRIHDVSIAGVKVSFDGAMDIEPGAITQTSMFAEGIGFIAAVMQARWAQRKDGRLLVGFSVAEMDLTSTNRLREAIKNFTFVDTSRGEY